MGQRAVQQDHRGPTVRDPNFIYLQHGQLHIGDFNTTVKSTGSPPGLEWRYQLQVEGEGYIRTLSHGYPHKKQGLEALVESVEVSEGIRSNQKVLNNLVILVAPAGKLLHEVVVALR
eukprot:COSAG02_NODE_5029_length_4717_cov_3.581854_3_plen_117_part_00